MDYEITQHGTDNKGLENINGYCQAVSGLHPMTDEYDAMLTAEGKFWLKLKQSNPDAWKAQLNRLKATRGTIFTDRLSKCFKWLNRKAKNLQSTTKED